MELWPFSSHYARTHMLLIIWAKELKMETSTRLKWKIVYFYDTITGIKWICWQVAIIIHGSCACHKVCCFRIFSHTDHLNLHLIFRWSHFNNSHPNGKEITSHRTRIRIRIRIRRRTRTEKIAYIFQIVFFWWVIGSYKIMRCVI